MNVFDEKYNYLPSLSARLSRDESEREVNMRTLLAHLTMAGHYSL